MAILTEKILKSLNEDDRKLITYLNSFGLGVIYFSLGKNNQVKQITIDGISYNPKNESDLQKLGTHICKILETISFATEEYLHYKKLPFEISPFIYKYHPRWIMLREKNGVVKTKPQDILCPLSGEKNINEWDAFFFHSIGVKAPQSNSNKTLSADDYLVVAAAKEVLLIKRYEEKLLNRFANRYKGTEEEEMVLIKCMDMLSSELSPQELMDFKSKIDAILSEFNHFLFVESSKKISTKFCRNYYLDFQRTIYFYQKLRDKNVHLGKADDGFVVLTFDGKRFDLRRKAALSRLNGEMKKYVRDLRSQS